MEFYELKLFEKWLNFFKTTKKEGDPKNPMKSKDNRLENRLLKKQCSIGIKACKSLIKNIEKGIDEETHKKACSSYRLVDWILNSYVED